MKSHRILRLVAIVFVLFLASSESWAANPTSCSGGTPGQCNSSNGQGGITDFSCTVSGNSGPITSVTLNTNLTFPFALARNEFRWKLIAPDGTTWDDSSFHPAGGSVNTVLATQFDGISSNGTWTLQSNDTNCNDVVNATLNSWSLTFSLGAGVANPSVSFVESTLNEDGAPFFHAQIITDDGNPTTAAATFDVVLDPNQAATLGSNDLDWFDGAGTPNTRSFSVPSGTANNTSINILKVVDDAILERTETFRVRVGNPVNINGSSTFRSTTITDDEIGEVNFSSAATGVPEGTVNHPITVVLTVTSDDGSGSAASSVRGNILKTGGTATGDGTCPSFDWDWNDPNSPSSPQFFLTTTKTFGIDICNDAAADNGETIIFGMTLNNPPPTVTIGSTATHSVTIGGPAAVTVSIADATVAENAGPMVFTVTLSAPAPAGGMTFQWATASGGCCPATAGTDYTAQSLTTKAIAAGSSSTTISVPITNDTIVEGSETFLVNLSNPTAGYTIGDGQAIGTITNDDTSFQVFDPNDPLEGDGGGNTPVSIRVQRNGLRPAGQTVQIQTLVNGTALGGGVDFTELPLTTLTFALNESFQTVTVNLKADDVDEADETFGVQLSNPSGGTVITGTNPITVTIIDDDNPTLSIDDVTVNENAGTADFTVTKTGATAFSPVTVQYNTSNNGATAPADYTSTTGTLTFTPGSASETMTISVPIIDDDLQENSEQFRVNLFNAVNADITDNRGDGTITDNDVPSVSINDVTVSEGAGAATFTVSTGVRLMNPATITFSTADGGPGPNDAVAPGDYTAVSGGNVFVSAGASSTTLNVVIIDDPTIEPDEEFTVTLTNAGGLTIADDTGIGTIRDNDLSFSIDDVTVDEADGTATFTVTQTGAAGGATSVQYATSDVSAVQPDDYTSTSGTLNFSGAAGETKQVVVTIIDDDLEESTETFEVMLSNPTGGPNLGDDTGQGTINDNDVPMITINDVSVNESAGTASFTVSSGVRVQSATTINFSTSDGGPGPNDAVAPGDYTARIGQTVVIPGGSNSVALNVTIIDDSVVEPSEEFTVTLNSTTSGSITDNTGIGTITDNDRALVIDDVTVNESAGTATFTVTQNGVSGSAVSVEFNTSDNGAVAPGDYTSTSGTLNFSGAGGETKNIVVTIIDDDLQESSEGFQVNLVNPVGIAIDDGTGDGTITDNDVPMITINDVTVDEGDGTASFTVSSGVRVQNDTTIDVDTSDGGPGANDAVAPGDYTAISGGSVTILAGNNSVSLDVTIIDDATIELSEEFTVTLSNSSNGSISDDTGIGTITDNDLAFSIDDVTVDESAGTLAFTVTQLGVAGGATSVQYATSDVSATDPDDYVATNGTLNFSGAAGETQQFSVTINEDDLQESSETFEAMLSNPTGGPGIADGTGVGTITDNDVPTITINDVTIDEGDGTASFTVSSGVRVQFDTTVDFDTADGGPGPDDAVAPGDYTAIVAGSVVIMAGNNSVSLNVTIIDDGDVEPDEEFTVTLSSTDNGSITDDTGIGTILDNEIADLSLVKTAEPLMVSASETVTYTLVVSNAGPADATNTIITDVLPAGMGYLSSTTSQGAGCTEFGGTVTCDMGTIANGSSAEATIVVETLEPGSFENSAVAGSDLADADGAAGTAPAVAAAASDVPTLDPRALAVLLLLLALAGVAVIRR